MENHIGSFIRDFAAEYGLEICCGLENLEYENISSQKYLEDIVYSGKNAKSVSEDLRLLKGLSLLNNENWEEVLHRIPPNFSLFPLLNEMQQANYFTKERTDALLWNGPSHLHNLTHSINRMFAHGLFLLSCSPEKGKAAIKLALDLKFQLKAFITLPDEEQAVRSHQFKTNFTSSLHSQDHLMSIHRMYWKILVANILVALTGIGLIAISANYFVTGNVFFTKTKSEQFKDQIEHNARLLTMSV